MVKNGKPRKVFRKPRRTAWIGMRLLPGEKESVRLAAGAREMDMTGYLLHLHRCALGAEKKP